MSAVLAAPRLPGGHGVIMRALMRKLRWLFALLGVLSVLCVGVMVATNAEFPRKLAPPFFAAELVVLWWTAFMQLQIQNHPVAARLVPGQLRHLRETALALFLALSFGCGALMAAGGFDLGVWTMLAAIVLASLSVLSRWPLLWFFVWLVPSTSFAWRKGALVQALTEMLVDGYQHQPLTLTAVVLALSSAVVWRMLQSGGPAHVRQYCWTRAMTMAARSNALTGWDTGAAQGRTGRFFHHLFGWLLSIWREHLLRVALPTARSAVARAELCASGGTHWTIVIGSSLLILSIVLIIVMIVSLTGGSDVARAMRSAASGVSFGVMSMVLNPVLGSAGGLYKRRREQALLLLLPGMPRGEALNRQLARRQMIQFLLCWCFGLGLVVLIHTVLSDRAAGAKGLEIYNWGVSYATLALPSSVLLWRDWSRQGVPNQAVMAAAIFVMVLWIMGIGWLVSRTGLSVWTLLAGSIAITGLLLALRWPRVVRKPTFWPVGRWA